MGHGLENNQIGFNAWVSLVVFEDKVFFFEVVDSFNIANNFKFGKGVRFADELLLGNFEVVFVEVCIADRDDELPSFEASEMCDHFE